ncbi:MAG: F0F1 ATP synthase subunit B [Acidobacteriota bacterium]
MVPLLATTALTTEELVTPEGLGALGIDGSALAFQVLNFVIVLLVLHRFAYKPILKVLEGRRRRIEESLKTAKELQQQRQELAQEQEKTLRVARQTARDIIGRAEAAAEKLTTDAAAQAHAASEKLMKETAAKVEHDITQAKTALQSELLLLVATAASNVIQEKIDAQKDEALIREALEAARNHS